MIHFEKLRAGEKMRVASGLLAAVACLAFLWVDFAQAAGFRTEKVAILISGNIRPYVEAVEGMITVFAESTGAEVTVWYLDKFPENNRTALFDELAKGAFDVCISVGPEAARFIWASTLPGDTVRFYSVILNPEQALDGYSRLCGVSLNIPTHRQLEVITQALPGVSRVGILYDPRYNAAFVAEASREASGTPVIVPLAVSSKKDIPGVLKERWADVDALWLIPDRTVISESIIKYVIKESIFRMLPVIGYNRFFYENGAALAFVFNYEELGKQCAVEALKALSGGECGKTPPFFHVWVNPRVVKKLGIPVIEDYVFPIEVGP
jgi:putative ABC transport system substrate-binding protein